jgi:very-short-patch-repair endonuclease
MRAVLADRIDGYEPTRSELERELDAILVTVPCPPPLREVQLGDRVEMPQIVDRLYIDPRQLIVEGDGRLWHARLEAMTRDRARDRRALELGYPTARYGWHELRHERDDVRREICSILGVVP